jgi:LPXTG-site transpeptidase (sortase) family protein
MRFAPRPALLASLLASSLLVVACGGGDKNDDEGTVSSLPSASATTGQGAGTTPAVAATTAQGMPVPKKGTILERIVAPSIRLDSAVEIKGLDSRGQMEEPTDKDAVAWYNFSEFPGFGGNAVFSGHVDWRTGEMGSFFRMKELKEGDEILVKISDGMEMRYKVVSSKLYESKEAPVTEITGVTPKDSLTFITCEGTFNQSARDYSHRRVVRAERVA